MDKLNELEALWQNIQPTIASLSEADLKNTGILNKLKRLEQKHFRINLAKTIGVSIALVFLSYTILNHASISVLTKIALGWIICSLIIVMRFYWKMQYKTSDLNFSEDKTNFIKDTIAKLKLQKQIVTHLLPIMVLSLLIGMNVIYIDLLKTEEFSFRIIFHLSFTLFLILMMYLGLKIRKKRFNKDFKPLIDELESIKENFQDEEH